MAFIIDAVEDVFDFVGDVFDKAVDLVEGVIDVVLDAGEWVVDEIVTPVINGVGDIVDYALDNPIEAVAILATTVLAGPTAAVLGTTTTAVTAAATWAIPLATGANTLAKGGDIGDAIKAATIAYAGATAGKVAGQYAQTAVQQATGSNIASQIIGAGSKRAATAVVYGQDPVEAFKNGGITAGVGAAMGAVSERIDTIARDTFNVAENELTGFEGLDEGVQNSIFAALGAELGGEDLSGAAFLTAADPAKALFSIVDKYANIGVTVDKFLEDNVFGSLNDAQVAILTDAVSNSFNTALYNNPELSGEAFFGTFREQAFDDLKEIINKPVFKTIDQLSGAYNDTQASATALQKVEAALVGDAERYNKFRDLINNGVAEQDRLYSNYQSALNRYNSNKNEANANAVNDAAKALESFATKFKSDYETEYKPGLDDAKNDYDKNEKLFNDSQETYQNNLGYVLSEIDDLGDKFKPLYEETNRQALLALKPDFDEDYYREKYGLSEDESVVDHFFAQENYTNLEVSKPKEEAPEVDTTAPQPPVLDEEATEERPTEELPEGIEEPAPEIKDPPVIEAPADVIDKPPVIDTAEEVLDSIIQETAEDTVEQPDFYEGYFKEGEALREEALEEAEEESIIDIAKKNLAALGYNVGSGVLEALAFNVKGAADLGDVLDTELKKVYGEGGELDLTKALQLENEFLKRFQEDDTRFLRDATGGFVNWLDGTSNNLKQKISGDLLLRQLNALPASMDFTTALPGGEVALDRLGRPYGTDKFATFLNASEEFGDVATDVLVTLIPYVGPLLTVSLGALEGYGAAKEEIDAHVKRAVDGGELDDNLLWQTLVADADGDVEKATQQLQDKFYRSALAAGSLEGIGDFITAKAAVGTLGIKTIQDIYTKLSPGQRKALGIPINISVAGISGGLTEAGQTAITEKALRDFGIDPGSEAGGAFLLGVAGQGGAVSVANTAQEIKDALIAKYNDGDLSSDVATYVEKNLLDPDGAFGGTGLEIIESPVTPEDIQDNVDNVLEISNKDTVPEALDPVTFDEPAVGDDTTPTIDMEPDTPQVDDTYISQFDEIDAFEGDAIKPSAEPETELETETLLTQPLEETLGDNVIDFTPKDPVTPPLDDETSNIYADILGTDIESLTDSDVAQVDNVINLIEEDISTQVTPIDTVIDTTLGTETDTTADTAVDTAISTAVTTQPDPQLVGLAQLLSRRQQPGYIIGRTETEEGGDLDYIYDFGSIFPQQEEEKTFTKPFQQYTTSTYDPLKQGLGVLSLEEYLDSLKQEDEKDTDDEDDEDDEDREFLQVFGSV